MENKFKPFQQVLVRFNEECTWVCDIYSHYDNEDGFYSCIGGLHRCCIPYEGNEHLLGTTDEPKPKPKPKMHRVVQVEEYYSICKPLTLERYGVVKTTNEGRPWDKECLATGNYFRTKEEAEAMVEKIKELLKGGND